MNNKLYVGNLSFDTAEIQLQDLFSQAGTVNEASLVQDRATGQSRGFAFVTMGTSAEAEEAIRRFNGSELNGRTLNISVARPREERSGSPAPRNKFRARY
jgi:cold-inducible RNA-binding protein